MRTVAWIVAGLVVLGMLFGNSDEDQADRGGDQGASEDDRDEAPGTAAETSPDQERDRVRTYLVSHVVDGDTLELGNGEIVRLAGIDAPEQGACGSIRATENLQRLALGKQVRLGASDEDRDQYGRLLRYVDVGDMDAGLRLIKNGFAVARYDSRDGYGRHPREDRYIAADAASKNFTCTKPTQAVPFAGSNCAPGYEPCIPPYPPDLDCADVNGPIYVTGIDPHGLDGDGDGVACE